MYAIIKTGGKQYKVKKGDVIDVELLSTESGEQVEFRDVLLVNDGDNSFVGGPLLSDYFVTGKLLDTIKGPKINSLKYKPTQYKRFGHRQKYARVEIQDIHSPHSSSKPSKAKKTKVEDASHGT